MYKLFNKIFGWDYVIKITVFSTYIVRIRKAKCGKVYYKHWFDYGEVLHAENYIWITCEPEKYIKKREVRND